jgi:hypothetical protein
VIRSKLDSIGLLNGKSGASYQCRRNTVVSLTKNGFISPPDKKMHYLPPHPLTENKTDAFVMKPKATSCRYPVKVMFQGITGHPCPEHGFNGQVLLK